MASQPVFRGDVFKAKLDPTEGSEQAGQRPVAVVSRDAINANSPVVVVVPATDAKNKKRTYPSHVIVPAGTAGLTLESVFICEQVRAISKSRLVSHLGRLDRATMTRVDAALKITLDLP